MRHLEIAEGRYLEREVFEHSKIMGETSHVGEKPNKDQRHEGDVEIEHESRRVDLVQSLFLHGAPEGFSQALEHCSQIKGRKLLLLLHHCWDVGLSFLWAIACRVVRRLEFCGQPLKRDGEPLLESLVHYCAARFKVDRARLQLLRRVEVAAETRRLDLRQGLREFAAVQVAVVHDIYEIHKLAELGEEVFRLTVKVVLGSDRLQEGLCLDVHVGEFSVNAEKASVELRVIEFLEIQRRLLEGVHVRNLTLVN